jgi:hypothetical protein
MNEKRIPEKGKAGELVKKLRLECPELKIYSKRTIMEAQ